MIYRDEIFVEKTEMITVILSSLVPGFLGEALMSESYLCNFGMLKNEMGGMSIPGYVKLKGEGEGQAVRDFLGLVVPQ